MFLKQTMKIVINGRFLAQKTTGVQRVAIEVTKHLDSLVNKGVIVVAAPIDSFIELNLKNIEVVKVGGKSSQKWIQWDLYRFARQNGAEILTYSGLGSFFAPGYYFAHDVTFRRFPESYDWKFRIAYGLFYKKCLKRCKHIFTVSEFSKNELIKLYDLADDDIDVVYNSYGSIETKIQQNVISGFGLIESNYYLTIGSHNFHKNQSFIIKLAEAHPEKTFVIVGERESRAFDRVKQYDVGNVVYTGYVSDEKLVSLYYYALGFIFPSLYEGFGIPPLEAIVYGCPKVAVSNIPVHREIYSKGVYFFNPEEALSFDFEKYNDSVITEDDKNYYINKYKWNDSAKKIKGYLI